MGATIRGISSMATRLVLAELSDAWQKRGGCKVEIESVGGVDAAKRVQAGEAFDVVFLASDAIDKLVADGSVASDGKVDLMRSGVAVAVPAGAAHPDISTEQAVRHAVLQARTIGYSTGPSGVALRRLFEQWGIAGQIKDRIVQATPGVPVGSLVARGEVALGFQQLSELLHVEDLDIVGPLPEAIQFVTTFSAGICAGSSQPEEVRRMLAFMKSPEAGEAKRRQGMEPA